jgi:hypothetical protein
VTGLNRWTLGLVAAALLLSGCGAGTKTITATTPVTTPVTTPTTTGPSPSASPRHLREAERKQREKPRETRAAYRARKRKEAEARKRVLEAASRGQRIGGGPKGLEELKKKTEEAARRSKERS